MSIFAVTKRKIAKIWKHPNADTLDLAQVEGLGYQFCIRKDSYKVGEEVIYFPIDSILSADLSDHLKIKNFLAGKEKNRIKTIKLRKEISQGLITTLDNIEKWLKFKPDWNVVDITQLTKVQKYEPPEILIKNAYLRHLPKGVPVYDLESADNFPNWLDALLNKRVCITEKIEGTNFSATITTEQEFFVNQRNFTIIPKEDNPEGHTFWIIANELKLKEKLITLQKEFPNQQITFRGELIGPGIQKNIYKLKNFKVLFFDILIDKKYLDGLDWLKIYATLNLETVPVLAKDILLINWLQKFSLKDASNGFSILIDKQLREGIVIKPIIEETIEDQRLILKQRSPEYLANSDF